MICFIPPSCLTAGTKSDCIIILFFFFFSCFHRLRNTAGCPWTQNLVWEEKSCGNVVLLVIKHANSPFMVCSLMVCCLINQLKERMIKKRGVFYWRKNPVLYRWGVTLKPWRPVGSTQLYCIINSCFHKCSAEIICGLLYSLDFGYIKQILLCCLVF